MRTLDPEGIGDPDSLCPYIPQFLLPFVVIPFGRPVVIRLPQGPHTIDSDGIIHHLSGPYSVCKLISAWLFVFDGSAAYNMCLDLDRDLYCGNRNYRWGITLSPRFKHFGELWSYVSEGDCESMSANCWIYVSDSVRVVCRKHRCRLDAYLQCGFIRMCVNSCLLLFHCS